MDKDGSIVLDPALALKPKTLRVRISEGGKITGTSRLPTESEKNHTAIERTIQLARDSLFEEELYHEMSLETRHLLPYGVEYQDSVIHVQAAGADGQHHAKEMLIDCITRDDHSTGNQDDSNDWLAQNVAEGLRLLLAHEHSMRLYRRSQLPPPLNGQKRDTPPPPLLRTLLAVFRHLEGVDCLYQYLERVAKTLESAGVGIKVETTRELSWARLASSLQTSSRKGMTSTDQLLEIFSKPFDGKATMTLASSSGVQPEILTISTRTVIGQPTFGTEHKLTLPSTLVADLGLFQQLKFSSVEETTSYLDWILSLHIAHRQLKNDFSPRVFIKSREATVTIQSKDTKTESTIEQDITVEMQNAELKVTIADDPLETTGGADKSYIWTGQEGDISLTDKIKGWIE
jgi:mediator of RNA polymerase II transcription subunit 17, fungi type